MIDYYSYTHNLSSGEIQDWKKSDLNGIWTHDPHDTSAVLYQQSYQAEVTRNGLMQTINL